VTTNNTADTPYFCSIRSCACASSIKASRLTTGGKEGEQVIGLDIATLLPEAARAGVCKTYPAAYSRERRNNHVYANALMEGSRRFLTVACWCATPAWPRGLSISDRNIIVRKNPGAEIARRSGGANARSSAETCRLRAIIDGVRSCCRPGGPHISALSDVVENVNEIVGHRQQSIDTARAPWRGSAARYGTRAA